MKRILIIMSLFSTIFGVNAQDTDQIKVINPQEFKVAISQKNTQLVDIRTAREFRSGHIQKAVNIDFYQQKEFVDKMNKMDKNKPVYIYCRSGMRSRNASRKLLNMGFTQIFDLQGGYINWNMNR